jgi:hypothetical protein
MLVLLLLKIKLYCSSYSKYGSSPSSSKLSYIGFLLLLLPPPQDYIMLLPLPPPVLHQSESAEIMKG